MPTKRAILAELTRDELCINVDHCELEAEDRRVKTQLDDALSRSRQAPLNEILHLAARLMGRTAASRDADAAMPPAVSASVMDKLSVTQLEQSLWSTADIFRGSTDSSDYKTYIFGLLFLKRLSDRFEESRHRWNVAAFEFSSIRRFFGVQFSVSPGGAIPDVP